MSRYGIKLSLVFSSILILGTSLIIPGTLQSKPNKFKNIAAPDESGPYNVGTRLFESVPMTGGRRTRIQVFYPTLDPPNCQSTYTIQGVGGNYLRSSPLCMVQAANPAPGKFPLIVHDHGGGGAGNDAQRLSQLPVHETLASHGFVVALARHSANNVDRVRDLPLVINFMLDANNPLSASLDDRIGLSGFSAGGRAVLGVVGGWEAQGLIADSRVMAMVLYEPSRDNSLEDVATIDIPYLIMGGNRISNGLVTVPEVFETTDLATPRIYVRNPEALHFDYQTDLCPSIEETREAALLANPNQTEPLTNMVYPNPIGCEIDPMTGVCRRICNPAMGAAALQACTFWNQGELLINTVGPGFGGGRNVCTLLGVDSTRSLDTHPTDGLTDAYLGGDPLVPLFEGNDIWSNASSDALPIPYEIMMPMVKLYTVAFWKTFLEGDERYNRYLTPGYANVHDLVAEVHRVGE